MEKKEHIWHWYYIFKIPRFKEEIKKNLFNVLLSLFMMPLEILIIVFLDFLNEDGNILPAITAMICLTIISLAVSTIPTFKIKGNAIPKIVTFTIVLTISLLIYFVCTFKKFINFPDFIFDNSIYLVVIVSVVQFFYSLLASVPFANIKSDFIKKKKAELQLSNGGTGDYETD